MFFQSVFDSCDGELARLRYQFSKLGQWLDNIADDIVDAGLIVGLGYAAGHGHPGSIWPWLGIAGGISRVVTQLALYLQVTRAGGDFWNFRWWFETEVATLDQVYDPTSIVTWLRSLGRRDVYVFGWAVLCAAGVPFVAAGWGLGVAAVQLGLTVIQLVVTARRAAAVGR
jgi:phosphatidylglycerophosphate synthase